MKISENFDDDEFDNYIKLEQEKSEYKNFSYEDTIRQNYMPDWRCPYCQRQGTLKLKNNKLSHIETNESKKIRKDEYFEQDWLKFVSSLYLKCSYCKDTVSVVGWGTVDTFEEYPEYDTDEEKKALILTSAGAQWAEASIHPLYFYPPIHLFKIPVRTPNKIKEKIIESFSLAWSDYSASGNKIRIAIEYFIDEIDNSLKDDSLGNKINELEKKEKYNLLAKRLKAIKWLGNQASHKSKSLASCDVGFTYTIFEKLLNDKYNNVKNIDKFVEKINQEKKSLL